VGYSSKSLTLRPASKPIAMVQQKKGTTTGGEEHAYGGEGAEGAAGRCGPRGPAWLRERLKV